MFKINENNGIIIVYMIIIYVYIYIFTDLYGTI